MREVELKAVVDDVAQRRRKVESAGGKLSFEGKISDRRYDFASHDLSSRDEVLRTRTYISKNSTRTYLDWKGPTESRDVYKVREEVTTPVDDRASLETILEKLGFVVTLEIDREIAQYQLGDATIRFEVYPRMDALVEVEGEPDMIESADFRAELSAVGGSLTSWRTSSTEREFGLLLPIEKCKAPYFEPTDHCALLTNCELGGLLRSTNTAKWLRTNSGLPTTRW
jgi:predicted adenylyl cyclase CyaB